PISPKHLQLSPLTMQSMMPLGDNIHRVSGFSAASSLSPMSSMAHLALVGVVDGLVQQFGLVRPQVVAEVRLCFAQGTGGGVELRHVGQAPGGVEVANAERVFLYV